MKKITTRDTVMLLIDVSFFDEQFTWEEVHQALIDHMYKIMVSGQESPIEVGNIRLFTEE